MKRIEPSNAFAHFSIRHLVIVLSPIAAHFGCIGMISRNANFRSVVNWRVRPLSNLALVTNREIEDREERLSFLAISPVSFLATVVPNLTRLFQVVVFLAVVGAVIAGLSQILRIHFESRRKLGHAPHMFGTR